MYIYQTRLYVGVSNTSHLYGQMLFLYEGFYSFEYVLKHLENPQTLTSVRNVFVLFTE